MMRTASFILVLALTLPAAGMAQDPAAPAGGQGAETTAGERPERAPDEKMWARFPQLVTVADLVGVEVIDDELRYLGPVDAVVAENGRFSLVITYGSLLGHGGRQVALPVEALAILGDRIMLLDLPRDALEQRPTWYGSGSRTLEGQERIRVAITSR